MSTKKHFNFISGLPRSGSTLLSGILQQNPKFSTSISDPLCGCVTSVINTISESEAKAIIKNEKIDDILYDFFYSYYKECKNKIVFNTNRQWTNHTHLLKKLFPDFKMIVCVRDIPWIIDSVERLHRKNIYAVTPMVGSKTRDVYERAHYMMGNHTNNQSKGFIIEPLFGVKNAIACDEQENLLFLEYDALARFPNVVMKRVYDFLEQPYFAHDFRNVIVDHSEYDKALNCEGLHTVGRQVEYKERESIIPHDLWNLYMSETIWKINPSLLNHANAILA